MLAKSISAATRGTEGIRIVIETDISNGMPGMTVVGLADTTVKEARERIRSAFTNTGKAYPNRRITVNMSPADIRKRGSHFDLAIALGILAGTGQVSGKHLSEYAILGELSLDGKVNGCRGILPMVMALRKEGSKKVLLPAANLQEAELVSGIALYPCETLQEAAEHLNGEKEIRPVVNCRRVFSGTRGEETCDFADVRGQAMAKRAVTVAVAGGHGLLMTGSPASGKTMIAQRIPGILPEMTYDEIVEATEIYSVAGLLGEGRQAITERPFRQPHHRITPAGFAGGGAFPVPGEISLAHKGVLFLDEVGEFERSVIELLRIPLEKKEISLVRQGETFVFPADFLLIAATNPCRCGYYGDPSGRCHCTEKEVVQYQAKISGAVLDRIDLHIHLQPVAYRDLEGEDGEDSASMRKKIEEVREIQRKRYKGLGITLNHQLSPHDTGRFCGLDREGTALMEEAYERLNLNPRTVEKTKKIARTIADLAGEETIGVSHLAEALRYREVKG